MSKNKNPKEKKLKPGYTKCPDCGGQYKIGMPHTMFCEAHTCENCGTSFGQVVEKDADGRRVCEQCQNPEEE